MAAGDLVPVFSCQNLCWASTLALSYHLGNYRIMLNKPMAAGVTTLGGGNKLTPPAEKYKDGLSRIQASGTQVTQRIADELATELQLNIRLFGLTDAQAEQTKAALASFYQAEGELGLAI
jgi:hypothetical protein